MEGDSVRHEELVEVTKKLLNQVIRNDLILKDLPSDVTLDEVNAKIAVEYGQSMTVYVVRADGEELPVIVKHGTARVSDLKRAIRSHVTLKLKREGENAKISWRHVWRTYWLVFEGVKLQNDNELLQNYGIVNKSRITFVKRLRRRHT